jgi:hypothetical protein
MANARRRYPAETHVFSDQLCMFMDAHPAFERSLKLVNTSRFHFLGWIITSRTPPSHARSKDQVIGVWYLDKQNHAAGRAPFFKQDFIVNIGARQDEYVSFLDKQTLSQAGGSPFVRLIDDFFIDYGEAGKYYHRGHDRPWLHHFDDVGDLPSEFHESARRAKAENPLVKVTASS